MRDVRVSEVLDCLMEGLRDVKGFAHRCLLCPSYTLLLARPLQNRKPRARKFLRVRVGILSLSDEWGGDMTSVYERVTIEEAKERLRSEKQPPWDELDPGILPIVKALYEEGIETYESC